jgi:hypothetical protein
VFHESMEQQSFFSQKFMHRQCRVRSCDVMVDKVGRCGVMVEKVGRCGVMVETEVQPSSA